MPAALTVTLGNSPVLAALPQPPCAARTLDDRDEASVAHPAGPGTRGDKCISKKGVKERRGTRFRPIPDTGIFSGLTSP